MPSWIHLHHAGPRDVESLKNFVLNEAGKAVEAKLAEAEL
jgi:hypothetical protein